MSRVNCCARALTVASKRFGPDTETGSWFDDHFSGKMP